MSSAREVLANALVDRDLADWSRSRAIEVRVADDRMIVTNPNSASTELSKTVHEITRELNRVRQTWIRRIANNFDSIYFVSLLEVGMFVGRTREMAALGAELDRVRESIAESARGRCVLIRGRRRVGKSRMIEEFCATQSAPSVIYTASRQRSGELQLFSEEISRSDLPGKAILADANPATWDAALRLLAASLDNHSPTIIVIDEFPYLVEDDPTLEATLQKQWDRLLSKKPILLVLIGSDLAMMEALNTHGRPFFQRGVEMIVPPLSPDETARIVGAPTAADAFDSYLITGGLPLICNDWRRGDSMWDFLEEALSAPTSPLIVSAERVLNAELPPEANTRGVLEQIGSGEISYAKIGRASGGLQAAALSRSLELLMTKRLVVRETPLSTARSKEARYRVGDSYLRFWLRFIGPGLAEIERGRSDRVIARIRRDWSGWRGKAVEPVLREALGRLSDSRGLPAADAVGGFWTRSNNPEIDIIGADKSPVADSIQYVGTIKWHDTEPLDQADLNRLSADVRHVSGANESTPLIAVSRTTITARGSINLTPNDLLSAWSSTN